jgi:hypothetical protein
MAARCVLQFLEFHGALTKYWVASKENCEPPWRSTTIQLTQMIHSLNLEHRAAFLDALGGYADNVKKLMGWQ